MGACQAGAKSSNSGGAKEGPCSPGQGPSINGCPNSRELAVHEGTGTHSRNEPIGLETHSTLVLPTTMHTAKLALEDGTVFVGEAFGARGEVNGEVCFNTSMTGYQEILTDPSYRGQIVAMTYPEIGNYGINSEDVESWKPHLAGFVVRERAAEFRVTSVRTKNWTPTSRGAALWAWKGSTRGDWSGGSVRRGP